MSMGNLFTRLARVLHTMATDQPKATIDDPPTGPDGERPSPPVIAHLTVVPENADRSS